MQGWRTAFSWRASCPAKIFIPKETGYLDREKEVLALETRLREGEVVLHPKYLEWVARLEEEYVRMTERTQRV